MSAVRAIVTGAARGIGRASALRLARDAADHGGARLVLSDMHGDELQVLAEELRQMGAQAVPVVGDLSQSDAPLALAQAAQAFGGLDAVASNAGFGTFGLLLDYAIEDWDKIFAVPVPAPWLLAKACHAELTKSPAPVAPPPPPPPPGRGAGEGRGGPAPGGDGDSRGGGEGGPTAVALSCCDVVVWGAWTASASRPDTSSGCTATPAPRARAARTTPACWSR